MWDVQELFRRYSRDLNRFLHHRVSSRESAADLTQDLFFKLLPTDNSAVVVDRKSYLFRAARNLALNHIKRERLIEFCDPSAWKHSLTTHHPLNVLSYRGRNLREWYVRERADDKTLAIEQGPAA